MSDSTRSWRRRLSAVSFGLLCASTALAGTDELSNYFELGDSLQPAVSGTAELQGDSEIPGPDWTDLFRADASLRDDVGADGEPPANGIPDFVDLHHGRAAVFVSDEVSAGSRTDFSVRRGASHLDNGVVADASDDLGNIYAYLTNDSTGHLLLFGGLERLQAGPGTIELELNQVTVRLGRGWPGTTGWEILAPRTPQDILVTLSFGIDGLPASLSVDRWADVTGSGDYAWTRTESLSGEPCNAGSADVTPPVAPDTVCAFQNAAAVPGGSWSAYDAAGQRIASLGADTFFEFGVNIGGLLGISDAASLDFQTIQVRTPSDLALGHFGRNIQ